MFLFLLSCCGVYLRDALKQFGISRRKSPRPLFVLAKLSRVSNDEGQEEGAHQEDERWAEQDVLLDFRRVLGLKRKGYDKRNKFPSSKKILPRRHTKLGTKGIFVFEDMGAQWRTDYRCEDNKRQQSKTIKKYKYKRQKMKTIGQLRRHRCTRTGLDSLLEITSQNQNPSSQEIHMKIQHSSRCLKMSTSKPRCEVSALPITSLWNIYHQWLSDIELSQKSAFFIILFQD